MKGTGFLLESGQIITNWHVTNNCPAEDIIAISSKGVKQTVRKQISDKNRDLSILFTEKELKGGLKDK
jgi:hypothetical protein